MPETLKILIIEDDPIRVGFFKRWLPENFRLVAASSAGSALGLIERDCGFVYAGICLDHDLQGQVKTDKDRDLSGTTVVNAVMRYLDKRMPVLVHSMNPKRAPIMVGKLKSAGFDVLRIPMGDLSKTMFQEWCEEVRENWEDQKED